MRGKWLEVPSIDIGSRRIYTYHVLGEIKDIGIDMRIVEEWFPKTARAMEIYILSNLLKRIDGEDSRMRKFENREFPLIFMTDKFIRQKDRHGKDFYVDNKNAIKEAIARANDFCRRGLLERNGNYLAVTFSGKRRLEELVYFSESARADMSRSIDAILNLLDTQHKELMESQAHLSLKLDEIINLKNAIESNQSAKISDVLSVTNDACSLLTNLSAFAPSLWSIFRAVVGAAASV